MSEPLSSHVALVSDLEVFMTSLEERVPKKSLRIFFKDDFLIEDAKAVIKEAYIAESDKKTIALGAKSFNLYAQNALLKILEEPPENIIFIVATPSKSALLPTIRSRMPFLDYRKQGAREPSGIDFHRFGLEEIYSFIQERKFLDKQALKALIQTIAQEALSQGVKLKEEDLELFAKLVRLAELNSRSHYILLTGLLAIYARIEK
jgi:DNA polymerase-3 subunit delta'